MTTMITKTTNIVERMFTVALSTSDVDDLVGSVNKVFVVVGSGLLVMALIKIIIHCQLKTNNKRYMHNMKQKILE